MNTGDPGARRLFLGVLPLPEQTAVGRVLRTETAGGVILVIAAAAALIWVNTPFRESYLALRDLHFGVSAIGLDLSVAHWATDGLLTIFFLVAGIELKRELVAGELRSPAAAALPVIAAICGMVVPALIYVLVALMGGGHLDGWAIPMATDIAFALAVLAVIGTHLPSGLRAFLLTLAVVDDLGAILVIAIFYTTDLNIAALIGAGVGLVVFALLQRFRVVGWWWYTPLAIMIWVLTYHGGVHATVAGVAMGLLLRARPDDGESASPAQRTGHVLHPFSAGIAVPLFALFAAGVSVSSGAIAAVFTTPEPLGIVLGLVAGKTLGIFAGTYLVARFTRAQLNPDLAWADVFSIAVLSGIGFTVSLLIGELAFPGGPLSEQVKAAVLVGSVLAALVASALLLRRNKIYKDLHLRETADLDLDGVPDIYQQPGSGAVRD
ncbi:MAG: Na+/H+ antiporter NhaA [Nocardiaceae bacterium]|nr:Na+/H+ antiporter NhaA [Nocardiaceae bacterium]